MSSCYSGYKELLKGNKGTKNDCGEVILLNRKENKMQIKLDDDVFISVRTFLKEVDSSSSIRIGTSNSKEEMIFSKEVAYYDNGGMVDIFNIIKGMGDGAVNGVVAGGNVGLKVGFLGGLLMSAGMVISAPVTASIGTYAIVTSAVVGFSSITGAATGAATYGILYTIDGAISGIGKDERDQIKEAQNILKAAIGSCPDGFSTRYQAYIPAADAPNKSIYTSMQCIPEYTTNADNIISAIEHLISMCEVSISKQIASCLSTGEDSFTECRDKAFSRDYKPYQYGSQIIDCDTKTLDLIGSFSEYYSDEL